jgi:hypothetical protein
VPSGGVYSEEHSPGVNRVQPSSHRPALCWIPALLLVASIGSAQQAGAPLASHRARIVGVFDFNTGAPIEGVEVTDMASGTMALTTRTGTVSLAFLPDGGSTVRVRRIGYTAITQFVAISPADTVPLTLMLTPTTTVLPTVVTKDSAPRYISPALRGFEERRKSGMGHFIPEAELRKSDSRQMIDVLRMLPGVAIKCSPRFQPDRQCFAVGRQSAEHPLMPGSSPCKYKTYIDGLVIADLNLAQMDVSQYAAVESYGGAATIPPIYNITGGACGVLLFWSRER